VIGSESCFYFLNRRLGTTRAGSHQATPAVGLPILNDVAMMTIVQWKI